MRDQVFEQNEAAFAGGRALNRNEARQRRRDLHSREVQLDALASRLLELDGERAREIRDIWKRVPAVDAQRRQHREDVVVERALERGLRLLVELRDAHQMNSLAFHRRQQLIVEQPHLLRQGRAQPIRYSGEMFGGHPAVFGAPDDLRLDLLFDRRDADHEELVEIRSVNGDEFQPLEHRIARVEPLFQHAVVEFEPRQLAADIERRIVERDDGKRFRRRLRLRNHRYCWVSPLERQKTCGMAELPSHVAQHLTLAITALLFALLAGLPLGVLAAESAALRGGVLALAGIGRTIPSLAVLMLLLPWLGVGAAPAIVALALLAIPPIVISVDVGIRGVPSAALDAATGMGMTPLQRFARVVVPLALPVSFAGLRTAATETIASATLATFIGAGGLGDEIVRGLQTDDPPLLFAAAAIVAVLALAADAALGVAGRIAART